jgi:flagellar biosynthesis/type III secretory pathway protein FliH
MLKAGKVLKIPVGSNPVLLKAEETLRRESHTQAEVIVAEAHAAAEGIRTEAIDLAQAERARAEEEAAGIVHEAEENRDALIHEASEQAREQARQEVLDTFRPQIEEGVEFFEKTVREAEKVWRGEFDRHKNEVIALALGIAEKIVRKISDEDRDLVRRTAEAALERAVDRQEVTLRVNPEDFAVLETYRIELLNRFEDLRTFKIEKDRRVDRGGAWIETPSGFVDARIRNQLEEILASVLPGAERNAKEP